MSPSIEAFWTTPPAADDQVERHWRELLARGLLEVDVEVAPGFSGTLRRRSLGRLQLNHVAVTAAQTLRRSTTQASRCEAPRYLLLCWRSGRGWLRHRVGETPLSPGECLLLHSHDPFELSFAAASDCLIFQLPVDWVELQLPDPQVAIAVALGKRQPWGPMLRGAMEALHSDRGTPTPFVLAENLCTALALAAEDIEIRSTRHVRKTFQSLQRTLAELASTCNVTAGEIAQAHGISLRYLHAIYSANGTSCGRELIRVRLERAQRLLLDPVEPGRSIDDIAWQCGFSDSSHFRRRFRALFGVSPSAMRLDTAAAG